MTKMAEIEVLQRALLTHPSVDACAIMFRRTVKGQAVMVAYVVPTGSFNSDVLNRHLRAEVPDAPLPDCWVAVSVLPLTSEGSVDDSALEHVEIIDDELILRWEQQIQAVPEIAQSAVVIRERALRPGSLHLEDLLPGWKRRRPELAPSTAPTVLSAEGAVTLKPAALSRGKQLCLRPDASKTLPEALRRAAIRQPKHGVRYVQMDGSEVFQSYPELLAEAEGILGGLRRLGLKPGDKVIFQFELNQDFIPVFWGCMLGGLVPVPIAVAPTYHQVNGAVSKLHNAWLMFDRPVVLTSLRLAPAIRSVSRLFKSEEFRVVVVEELRTAAPDYTCHSCQPDDLALILLTSGSTGLPKGVMQCHRSILARSAATIQHDDFTEHDVSLNWFPLDHVGGLVMYHIRDVYAACQQIQVTVQAILEEPLKWLDLVHRHRATITWAPNFAFALVNSRAKEFSPRQWDLSSLRFILNGGEAIVAKTARRFLQLLAPYGLPPTAMRPAWGMSETCSGVTSSHEFTLDSTTDDDAFVEVGPPLPEVALRIVDTLDCVVPEETIGRLQIQGPTITSGYYANPELNREVFTGDGWFNTGEDRKSVV